MPQAVGRLNIFEVHELQEGSGVLPSSIAPPAVRELLVLGHGGLSAT